MVALVAFAALVGAREGAAVPLRGRVTGHQHLRNPVWAEARLPANHGYSFREPVPTVALDHRPLFPLLSREVCVVAVSAAPGASRRAGVPKAEVRLTGGGSSPVTLVVSAGTELSFVNAEPFPRRPFGVGISTFAATPVRAGSNRKWTARDPGAFEFRDEVAPSTRVWVVALPAVAAVAYPTEDGEFVLDVPPGEYSLQSYFSGARVGEARPVSVARAAVDLRSNPIVLASPSQKKGGEN